MYLKFWCIHFNRSYSHSKYIVIYSENCDSNASNPINPYSNSSQLINPFLMHCTQTMLKSELLLAGIIFLYSSLTTVVITDTQVP